MKTKSLVPALGTLLLSIIMSSWITAAGSHDAKKEPLTIYSTADLKPIARMWVNAYPSTQPGTAPQLKVLDGADIGALELSGQSLVFCTREALGTLAEEPVWKMAVGRDVLIPVMSAGNPYIPEIYEQGISAEDLAGLFKGPQGAEWGILLGNGQDAPVHLYSVQDNSLQRTVDDFLGLAPGIFTGIPVASEQALFDALAADPYGIGFCRAFHFPEHENSSGAARILLLPIDKNNNGRLDYHEQIYGSLPELMRGVWIGKYPKALVHTLYAAAGRKPAGETAAFLKWVLNDGQQFLDLQGYSPLVLSERQTKVEALRREEMIPSTSTGMLSAGKIVVSILLMLVAGGLVVNSLIRARNLEQAVRKRLPGPPDVISDKTLDIPRGLYYDKTHTWVFMEPYGNVRVGIDDFLQRVTGDYSRVILKEPGDPVKKNEPVLTLCKNGKQLTVYSPVSGTIMAVNEELEDLPALINSSPYGEGWVYLVEPANWLREVLFLKMAVSYRDWLGHELSRLKDFLATRVDTRSFAYVDVVLQEGGEVCNHVLGKLGPEVWEDFQKHFIDGPC